MRSSQLNGEELIYIFFDGNGNKYVIENEAKKTVEYIPIKLFQSSSGVYDGGNYIKKEINDLLYEEIISYFNEAIKNKDIKIKNRVKMSGMIKIIQNNEIIRHILSPNSKELSKIEKILHNIINE